jgi:CDGSH-type Zn-finger protein
MTVMVKGLKNGPLEISDGVTVLDYKGKEYADAGDPVYLCRCGQSKSKPYCDGSHAVVGLNPKKQPDKIDLWRTREDARLNDPVVALILMGINLDYVNGRRRYG